MKEIIMYTKAHCPYCDRAKVLLAGKNVTVKEIRIDLDQEAFEALMKKSTMRTVPQIFLDDNLLGGYDDIAALDQSGALDKLLTGE